MPWFHFQLTLPTAYLVAFPCFWFQILKRKIRLIQLLFGNKDTGQTSLASSYKGGWLGWYVCSWGHISPESWLERQQNGKGANSLKYGLTGKKVYEQAVSRRTRWGQGRPWKLVRLMLVLADKREMEGIDPLRAQQSHNVTFCSACSPLAAFRLQYEELPVFQITKLWLPGKILGQSSDSIAPIKMQLTPGSGLGPHQQVRETSMTFRRTRTINSRTDACRVVNYSLSKYTDL